MKMSDYAPFKYAVNDTIGTDGFKSLNQLFRDDLGTVSEFLVTGNVPIVKSVQRGVSSITSKGSKSITINSIKPKKSLVILNCEEEQESVMLEELSSTSVTVSSATSGATDINFSWQVIEFN